MSQLDRAYKLKALLKGQITYLPYISKKDPQPPKKQLLCFQREKKTYK